MSSVVLLRYCARVYVEREYGYVHTFVQKLRCVASMSRWYRGYDGWGYERACVCVANMLENVLLLLK